MGPIMPVFWAMVKFFINIILRRPPAAIPSARLKRVFQAYDLWFRGIFYLRGIHLNHIEPGLQIRGMAEQIQLGGGAQLLLLTAVHKGSCAAVGGIFSQLYLHKAEIISILRNQVNLTKAAPPVRRQNAASPATQITGGQLLPPPAQQSALPPAHRFFKKVRRWMGLGA